MRSVPGELSRNLTFPSSSISSGRRGDEASAHGGADRGSTIRPMLCAVNGNSRILTPRLRSRSVSWRCSTVDHDLGAIVVAAFATNSSTSLSLTGRSLVPLHTPIRSSVTTPTGCGRPRRPSGRSSARCRRRSRRSSPHRSSPVENHARREILADTSRSSPAHPVCPASIGHPEAVSLLGELRRSLHGRPAPRYAPERIADRVIEDAGEMRGSEAVVITTMPAGHLRPRPPTRPPRPAGSHGSEPTGRVHPR